MHSIPFAALAAVLSASLATAQFWRMGHDTLLRTRLDPIVSPGKVAGHVHLFMGSSGISQDMDDAKAKAGACTTNGMAGDHSGYWTPQLYYKHRNGTYSALDGQGSVIYWMYRGLDHGEELAEPPADFRIVAGNTTRDYDDPENPAHFAVSYACYGYKAGEEQYSGDLRHLPTVRECPILRPQIIFPNCWNGVDSYKTDNSHVAYGSGSKQDGKCPEGWKRIPTLFIENFYSLGEKYEWYPGSLVFSNGDNHGYTFHADWLNGFTPGLLKGTYDQCKDTMKTGEFRDCPLMKQYEQPEGKCRIEQQEDAMIVAEPIGLDFPLAQLPGNNPEFNSSREGGMPRVARANYVETATFVRANNKDGGSCTWGKCTDYKGTAQSAGNGGDSGMAPAPAPSSSASSASASVSASPSGGMMSMTVSASVIASGTATSITDSATAAVTSANEGSMTAMPMPMPSLGQNLVADHNLDKPANAPSPVSASSPAPTSGSGTAVEVGADEELVCYRRKKSGMARRKRSRSTRRHL